MKRKRKHITTKNTTKRNRNGIPKGYSKFYLRQRLKGVLLDYNDTEVIFPKSVEYELVNEFLNLKFEVFIPLNGTSKVYFVIKTTHLYRRSNISFDRAFLNYKELSTELIKFDKLIGSLVSKGYNNGNEPEKFLKMCSTSDLIMFQTTKYENSVENSIENFKFIGV